MEEECRHSPFPTASTHSFSIQLTCGPLAFPNLANVDEHLVLGFGTTQNLISVSFSLSSLERQRGRERNICGYVKIYASSGFQAN